VAERIKLMKNAVITSEKEAADLRFAVQCLNRLCHRIPHSTNGVSGFNLGTLYSLKKLFLSKHVGIGLLLFIRI
jgi:hypothetical protein